jgi:hypothetical protein
MRIALIIVIGIHGIIHLFGFLKAFDLSEFNAIAQPISKMFGLFWLLAFVLFISTFVLLLNKSNYWWIIGITAVLISQFLIIMYWKDAKFGTLINLVVVISSLVGFGNFSFNKKVTAEISQMLANSKTSETPAVSERITSDLPHIIQKWLLHNGTIGHETIETVFLEQEAQILMTPEQKEWSYAEAKQHFTIEPPAFNWSVNLKMNSVINVVGRDKFMNGKGEMIIKLFSTIPMVNERHNDKIDQATLQRYLAEIVWFPSAVLSPYISWEAIDLYSARATMSYNGTVGSGVFHFDENGVFKKFVAMRYKDKKDAEPAEWIVTATKTEVRNGISIPVELKVDWKVNNHYWTWLKLKITNIEYNSK